ncbi:glycosyltransferase family 2 protein [Christiangramia sp. SM2212]|uniref:Glycosyltransferase family 2 protein n=1 Tax=Christiangramia sediminicola TaxID=3073267 RepID=A0ABU1EMU6_9FLAO|nr:glycosyltransferase family 2 protein [Christiangramia sp. SM2212]MDR5589706.1 glycosyltransferase family 2 protein [Christiangramia sp. SM2212]
MVSVIIPSYNRASIIGQTIESVLSQTFSDWECIVVDDGSEDNTEEVVNDYRKKDHRIKLYKRPSTYPKGANSCRNFGFQNSTGNYVQWLDSDDVISENKLEIQYNKLVESNADLGFCKWGRFGQNIRKEVFNGLPVYRSFNSSLEYLNHLADSVGYMPIHSYLMKRELVLRAGPWFEYLKVNQDGEFMARVISNSKKIEFSNEPVAYYRKKTANNISGTRNDNIADLIKSWKLIEVILNIRYGEDSNYFIEKTKERLYLNCKQFPEILKQNKSFFKRQIVMEPSKPAAWMHARLIKFYPARFILNPLKRIRRKILE